VQKHTLGEMGISVPKIIKIQKLVFKLESKMLGIFFETQSFFETGSVTAIQHFTTIKAKKLQFFSYI